MKRRLGGTTFYLVLLLLLIAAIRFINPPVSGTDEWSYDTLTKNLAEGKIKSMEMRGAEVSGITTGDKTFRSYVPEVLAGDFAAKAHASLEDHAITVKGFPRSENSLLITLLPSGLLLVGFVFLWYMMMQNNQGAGRTMNFGKSTAKQVPQDEPKKVTFADVAGLREEKEELEEIVDFLRHPRKFIDMGARIPKGVLLIGPPGTGKTYLSKAVAGEAGVPFFTMSGSDFVEMFVGVGASRVRDLFENAKRHAPCIIFIDEIDAVGRRRGSGLGGGHDEREQTLNQLLVEMDGFGTNEGVIVMAATNRADILDPALLRPGRFDRTIYVGVPDIRGREQILGIHSKKKPLGKDVDLKVIARRTAGFSPADLENLMNEAALLAARENHGEIHMKDIEEAALKVQAGPAKKSRVVTEKERKLTAVHEAGHAIVGRCLPNHDPVYLITIVPRGMAGGFTAYIPEEELNYSTRGELKNRLTTLLAGRVAESLLLDDISSGASNDIERATSIARAMVTELGMSEKLGTVAYGSDGEVFIGRDFGRTQHYSERTAAEIDEEIHQFIAEAYANAERILREKLDILVKVSDALLERETLEGQEFETLFSGGELEKSPYASSKEVIRKEDLSSEAKEIVEESDKEILEDQEHDEKTN